MYILLIIWFIFLFFYIIFNVYGLYRVSSMRIKGDATGTAILVYIGLILAVILISVFLFSILDWGTSFNDLFKT